MEHDNTRPSAGSYPEKSAPPQLSWNPSQQAAWEAINCGIQERQGGVVILGEAGTGKTALMYAFMASVDQHYIKTIYIANPTITFPALLKNISYALGLEIHTDFLSDMLLHLERLLTNTYKTQRHVALILDNAHSFSPTIFTNLWLLAQLKMADVNLIQLVLLGQPALAQQLAQYASPSLQRHLAVCVTLSPRLTTTPPPVLQRAGRTVWQKMLPVLAIAWQGVVQRMSNLPPTLPQLFAGVRTATRHYRGQLPVSRLRPLLAQARQYRPSWRAPDILAGWGRWRPRWEAALATGHSRGHQAMQYIVQHATGGYTHLRRCWLAACQAARPVSAHLLAYTLRQRRMRHMTKLWHTHSRPLALAGAAGLVLLAGLFWYTQRPAEITTPPANVGATAARQTPGLPAAPPPAVSTPTAPKQMASAAEAQSAVARLRTRFGGGTPTAAPAQNGEHIRRLQTRLKAAGFSPGPIDGVLGPQTRQALRQFQKANRLAATGELSQKTRQALGF
jgi:type II secretory pathway predicted ATPase ExeA